MSGKTEVINRALVKIGSNTISSPSESTEQARKTNMIFTGLAQAELRRQVWSFAKKRASLGQLLTNVGGDDFGASYALPADCLRLVWLNGSWVFTSIREGGFAGGQPVFAIEGKNLLSNDSGGANIVYISDVSEAVETWDSLFVDAFSCRLAFELAHPITKNLQLRQSIKQDYAAALSEAKRVNAIELPPQSIADDSWVLARLW
jgi:hypothetical protein